MFRDHVFRSTIEVAWQHCHLKIKEFKIRLHTDGGEVHYDFWNPVDDRVVIIKKKA